MKREELEELLQQGESLSADHEYICHKTPKVLQALQQVKRVPKDLRDSYDEVIMDLKYINDTM